MNSSTSVQMVSWCWGCQSCVVMDVLSSWLNVPSLWHPRTTQRILAQRVVVPQLQSISSPSPLHRAPTGPAGDLPPAMTITPSQDFASTICTCVAGPLFLRSLTVVQQLMGLVPSMGRRWNSACHLPHLHHLLSSHHISRRLFHPTSQLSHTVTGHEKVKIRWYSSWFALCPNYWLVLILTPSLKKPRQTSAFT